MRGGSLIVSQLPDEAKPLSVSELNAAVDGMLKTVPNLWVFGEITGWKEASSGHRYFSLKEGDIACVDCAMWKSYALRLPAGVTFRDGLAVLAYGKVGVFAKSGRYQLYVERILPHGLGAAEEALRRLKEKLLKLGYFSPDRKRPLPRFPRRIGLVTSGRGAAVRDMLEVFSRLGMACELIVSPVRVQGAGAAEEIAAAVAQLNQLHERGHLPIDVIILGRGGGSAEDLSAFNAEVVAHAVYHSQIPIISAVGHQVDYSISDQVADASAITPTDAAIRCVQHWIELPAVLNDIGQAMTQSMLRKCERYRQRLADLLTRAAFQRPIERIRSLEQRLDELNQRMLQGITTDLNRQRQRAASLAAQLQALSPLNVLARGYSLTLSEGGVIARTAQSIRIGDKLTTRLHRGEVDSIATNVRSSEE